MARPLSEEKHEAILSVAARLIAEEGVSAPTAKIARAAGVANGTLFTYFATKDALLNDLYASLKREVGQEILRGYPTSSSAAVRARHVWDRYVGWGVREDVKRRAMTQLAVSHRISPTAMGDAIEPLAILDDMLEDSMDRSIGLDTAIVAATMTALANVAIEFILRDPAAADRYADLGFLTFWRAIAER